MSTLSNPSWPGSRSPKHWVCDGRNSNALTWRLDSERQAICRCARSLSPPRRSARPSGLPPLATSVVSPLSSFCHAAGSEGFSTSRFARRRRFRIDWYDKRQSPAEHAHGSGTSRASQAYRRHPAPHVGAACACARRLHARGRPPIFCRDLPRRLPDTTPALWDGPCARNAPFRGRFAFP